MAYAPVVVAVVAVVADRVSGMALDTGWDKVQDTVDIEALHNPSRVYKGMDTVVSHRNQVKESLQQRTDDDNR